MGRNEKYIASKAKVKIHANILNVFSVSEDAFN